MLYIFIGGKFEKNYLLGAVAIFAIVISLSACKPYDKPVYVSVKSNETAFVIPLFNDNGTKTTDQIQVGSEEYYKKLQVNQKLIPIPHKWIKTGYGTTGKYYDTVAVILVSRTPISGSWLQNSDNAVKLETKESSGFQVPMKYTIRIKGEDAAKYLYYYTPEKKLQDVIDSTVQTWIVGELNKEFHKYSYTEISGIRDSTIADVVERAKVYFADSGITIDSITAYDGIYWDDKNIQDNIDKEVAAKSSQRTKAQELLVAQAQNAIDVQNAKNERDVASIKASTVDVQLKQAKVKLAEQEVENSKILAEAQADAIKSSGARFNMPNTLIVTPEFSSGLGLDSFMKGYMPTK